MLGDLLLAGRSNGVAQLAIGAPPSTKPLVIDSVLGSERLAQNLVCVSAADVEIIDLRRQCTFVGPSRKTSLGLVGEHQVSSFVTVANLDAQLIERLRH